MKSTEPIIHQTIDQLSGTGEILSPKSYDELVLFVSNSQNSDGGFKNRDGSSDPYYSFFGFLIASGLGMKDELVRLKEYVRQNRDLSTCSYADRCALLIMESFFLKKHKKQWGKAIRIVSRFFSNKDYLQVSYNSFLTMLVVETLVGHPSLLVRKARRIIKKITVNEAMPISELFSVLILKCQLGEPFEEEMRLISGYFTGNSGFRIYPHVSNADLLSTAVALFAMKHCGIDRRLYAPSAIQFVESQFSDGAFLSGDGDLTRDLEYTFYGLLALTSVW